MKPKVAFFDFASCEGCQLAVLDLEEELLDLVNIVEIVNFREAISEKGEDYEIAFIEGSISSEHQIERIKKIRKQAKLLITIGACACTGNMQYLSNFFDFEEVKEYVYGDKAKYFDPVQSKPIDQIVNVDFQIPGCPIDKYEFLKVVKQVIAGGLPRIPNYPVCSECKMQGNECLLKKGILCLGPVTRAGCGAICCKNFKYCFGCRGLAPEFNIESFKDVLRSIGYKEKGIMAQFKIVNGKDIQLLQSGGK
ncbi:MAG: NADH:ubiquinone oxidoreductase [Spirochaetes bacterium]|nr:NADH:ubiquinone oxidoreductase [Spirochaetota bacterium]